MDWIRDDLVPKKSGVFVVTKATMERIMWFPYNTLYRSI